MLYHLQGALVVLVSISGAGCFLFPLVGTSRLSMISVIARRSNVKLSRICLVSWSGLPCAAEAPVVQLSNPFLGCKSTFAGGFEKCCNKG